MKTRKARKRLLTQVPQVKKKKNMKKKKIVGTCSPAQVDPTGVCGNVNRVFARDGNSSINLASQGHCAGVFIGV
jgi:hypothetical protein